MIVLGLVAPCGERVTAEPNPALLPNLTGRWTMVQVMPALATLPILGDVKVTTTVTSLVDVEQDGASLTLRDAYCSSSVEMTPPLVAMRIPEAFLALLRPAPREASLEARDGGWQFVQPPVTEIRGAVLAHPETDSLPTHAADARVIDQDGDGHPGLTVSVSVAGLVSGDTYVVERLRFSLCGRVTAPDTIIGSIDWQSEQRIVAATDALLLLSYAYRPDRDSTRHLFLMRRTGADGTCARARELLAELLQAAGS